MSLRVNPDGKWAAHCFRATCCFSASTRGFSNELLRPKAEPRYYTKPTQTMSPCQAQMFRAAFGLEVNVRYAVDSDRFLLPVYGPRHQTRGYIARSLSGAQPKTLVYKEIVDEPFIGHHRRRDGARCIVVEDWLSAEKVVTAGYNSVALHGTHLTQEMVTEISNTYIGVCLALDKDAFSKSLSYQVKYGDQFTPRLRVIKLDKDLKYVNVGDIRQLVVGYSTCGKENLSGNHQGPS